MSSRQLKKRTKSFELAAQDAESQTHLVTAILKQLAEREEAALVQSSSIGDSRQDARAHMRSEAMEVMQTIL